MADDQIALLPEHVLGRKHVPKRGHAARPGSGPEGQTCGTCRHRVSVDGGARWYTKCGLTRGT